MNRINKLQEKMKKSSIDGILIFKPENIYYFTGFAGDSTYLLISSNEVVLITNFIYFEDVKRQTKHRVVDYKSNLADVLKQNINQMCIKTLGFEDNFLTVLQYNTLVSDIQMNLKPVGALVDELRIIKDDKEVNSIKKAVNLGDKAFSYIINFIKPGMLERDIALELEYFLKKNGAEHLSFDCIVASGINSSMPHAVPSAKKIENGDLVILDFGCKVDRYCSDMTRTIVVGKASERQKEIYKIVLEAQLKALDFISQGIKCSEVDKIARDYIAQNGFGQNFGHSLGHGVGLFVHEQPVLSTKSDSILKAGMAVTVEPGIYIEGFGGVRIEDLVIIRENGVDNLCKSSKQLIEI